MVSITLPVSSSFAEDANWTDKIKVGLEARVRNESNFDYDRNAKAEDKDNFSLLRARVNVTATPSENFRGFVQIQSSRVFGDSALSGTFGPGNTARGIAADDEDIALHQGYLDIMGNDLTFRVGRQEMIFGDQRLVGALGWSNRGRSFDGASLIHDTDSHKATLFFHLIQRNAAGTTTLALSPLPPTPPATVAVTLGAPGNNDPMFFGANLTLKEVGNGVDVYLFGFVDRDGQTINTVAGVPVKVQDGNLAFATLGFRTKSMPKDGFGYDLEGAVQGGENDDVGIMAFAGHAAFGFGVDSELAPKVLVEYNIASGDNPNTRRDTAFKNLFPTNHNKYGYIDFMGWSNMHNLRGGLSAEIVENLRLAADYHLFLAYEEQGAIGAGRAALAAVPGRTSKHFGQEVDILATYKHDKFFSALAGYSVFFPGDMHVYPINDNVQFAYVQLALSVN